MARKATKKESKSSNAMVEKIDETEIVFENGDKFSRTIAILKGNIGNDPKLQQFVKKDYIGKDIVELYEKLGGVWVSPDGVRHNVIK